MSSPRASPRVAVIAVQTLLGCVALGIWVLVSSIVSDDDVIRAAVGSLPFFVIYELGVLSRYVPGVKSVAKRLE